MSERLSGERLLHYVDAVVERFAKMEGSQPSTLQIKGYLRDAFDIKASSSDIAKGPIDCPQTGARVLRSTNL